MCCESVAHWRLELVPQARERLRRSARSRGGGGGGSGRAEMADGLVAGAGVMGGAEATPSSSPPKPNEKVEDDEAPSWSTAIGFDVTAASAPASSPPAPALCNCNSPRPNSASMRRSTQPYVPPLPASSSSAPSATSAPSAPFAPAPTSVSAVSSRRSMPTGVCVSAARGRPDGVRSAYLACGSASLIMSSMRSRRSEIRSVACSTAGRSLSASMRDSAEEQREAEARVRREAANLCVAAAATPALRATRAPPSSSSSSSSSSASKRIGTSMPPPATLPSLMFAGVGRGSGGG